VLGLPHGKKSKVAERFKDFFQMIETQFQTKIGILRSDNGTEYFNKYLNTFLVFKGIIHNQLVMILHNKMVLPKETQTSL
jgi:hypothetical protein